MMKNQKYIAPHRGMPTEDIGGSSSRISVTGETVSLFYSNSGVRTADAGQSAGVVVEGILQNAPVCNTSGDQIGNNLNTSLSFTSTAFTTEIPLSYEDLEKIDNASFAERLSLVQTFVSNKKTADANGVPTVMANGDYVVDYRKGWIIGKKASTQTSLASAAYKTLGKASGSITPGTGATNLGKAEDSAHTSGDVGVMALGVRNDNDSTLAGTDLDYAPIATTAAGRVKILGGFPEDFVHTSGDNGLFTLSVRRDTAASSTATNGNYATFNTDSLGHLWNREGYASTAEDNANQVIAGTIRPLAVSTYSWTRFQNLGANATLNVKATPGNVKAVHCRNINAAAHYVQLHNTATVPAGGAVPLYTFLVPATSAITIGDTFFGEHGAHFTTGIAFAFSTTEATYTAATATDQMTHIMFK
jgi:hypothetical protein